MDYARLLAPAAAAAAAYPAPGSWIPQVPGEGIRLHAGYPFPAAIPHAELLAAAADLVASEGDRPLQYSGSPSMHGLPDLLAQHSRTRGLMQEGDTLLVTVGIMQALDLAAHAFLVPGDLVAVEGPTYMEALEIFRNYTPAVVVYPTDSDGLQTGVLADDLRRRRAAGQPLPKLVYTIPRYHNPTGLTLAPERGRELLALAEEHDFLVVEDDAYGELSFGPPPSTLKAMDTAGRVIHAGSLSKVIAPGLRVGWVVAPAPVVHHMGLFKRESELSWVHGTVARYLQAHDLDRRLDWLRSEYAARRDLMLDLLAREMPAGVRWTRPEGGFFVWLDLPGEADAEAVLERSLAAGVTFIPGRHFFPAGHGGGRSQLRLSFSYLPPEAMAEGVAVIGRLLRAG